MKIQNYQVGGGNPLLLIAGPCVAESLDLCRLVAAHMKPLCDELGINYVFKASFDKANRTAISGARGPGIEDGLEILSAIKTEFGVPVTTDVHESYQAEIVAPVVDLLQIPAFLCRQTDLLLACGEQAAKWNGAVNVKKGQFLRPEGMTHALAKVRSAGCENVLLTERGTTFGYDSLVVDFRGLELMRELAPVCFDATHSVQKPGGGGDKTTGERRFVPGLVRAACAVGVDALFIETHPNPESAPSDGPNMVPLTEMRLLLEKAIQIRDKTLETHS
ncbi:3-deoxy-8-phosphooctulonate synthase [bacterium]|nr:MAG: 3-deoxy-8-phosphooctulonate synthase [bacterium]